MFVLVTKITLVYTLNENTYANVITVNVKAKKCCNNKLIFVT